MGKLSDGTSVFDATLDRMLQCYRMGVDPVVMMSGGKDSTICLEMTILAAKMMDRLPVRVTMRDEEIMVPGTFEYCERVLNRREVDFAWIVMGQPIINVFDRIRPYWWVFDPLERDKWVRAKPPWAVDVQANAIQQLLSSTGWEARGVATDPGHRRFNQPQLAHVIGLRTEESNQRLLGLISAGGYLQPATPPDPLGIRPIYDWTTSDVWRAIKENKWDYNRAYDVLLRGGIPPAKARIAPPTLNIYGAEQLRLASAAWPEWFDLVCARLPGVRNVALFGVSTIQPERRYNETWEQCFERVCIKTAPEWIADRAELVRKATLSAHAKHSAGQAFPDTKICGYCNAKTGSWSNLTSSMYNGDPFNMFQSRAPYVQPEFFRPGAGTWKGTPVFN